MAIKISILGERILFLTTAIEKIEKEIPQHELVTNPDDFALNFVIEIFERFNWNNPPRQILAEDQKRLRERRL